jgi:sister chromatid cohesion protein DCC1
VHISLLIALPRTTTERLDDLRHTISLSLESSETSAVIKHGNQTWGLRQKNTSNALIILGLGETTADSSQIPEPTLKAVATIHDTVELVSEPTTGAVPVIKGKWHEKFARSR